MARNTTETESRVQTIERWALLIAISAALLVSLVLIKPSLPKEIVLLTGPEGSNYHTMGQRYAAALRSRGINVRAVATEGGLENLRRLEGVEKADATGTDRADLVADLQAIDDDSATIFVPRSKTAEYIDFRQFVHDMRDRIVSGDERKLKAEVLGSMDDR